MLSVLQCERWMRHFPVNLLINLLLACVIFLNAELGRILGIQYLPLAISVVWPATGVSLAALLFFGTRAAPGIFIGNWAYDFLHLYINDQETWAAPFTVAFVIASGSLAQALLGNYLIRRFSSVHYLFSVKDVFVLLIPAGILSCMVASTIGVIALSVYQRQPLSNELTPWLTFWLGDTFGVYIFTPLLVVWGLQRVSVPLRKFPFEAFMMFVSFIAISAGAFLFSYPLESLSIALAIWVTYRFRMHGATLAIPIMTLTWITATSLGYGTLQKEFIAEPLLILVLYLEMIVVLSLILAAVINERQEAWNILSTHNIDLKQELDVHRQSLQSKDIELASKGKTAQLGLMTSKIAETAREPLQKMGHYLGVTHSFLDKLFAWQGEIQEELEPQQIEVYQSNLKGLQEAVSYTEKYYAQTMRIMRVVAEHLAMNSSSTSDFSPINLNILLNMGVNQVMNQAENKQLSVTLVKEFDKTLRTLLVQPDDLVASFSFLIEHALVSIKKKNEQSTPQSLYMPLLEIRTQDYEDFISVIIKDNGMGLMPEEKAQFFHAYTTVEHKEDSTGLGILLAYNILTQFYHAKIELTSEQGEYTQIAIELPRH